PFYIYYSMFGFQRVGDLIWAAADQKPRGFLIGATSGRTTLAGEGLQHQDGSSHLWAMTVPNCRSYDPAFAGELAVIMAYGMQRMMLEQRDEFFYLTVMNENYVQAALPEGVEEDVIRGAYNFAHYPAEGGGDSTGVQRVTLMGSGAILTEVIQAAQQLAKQNISVDVVSITSWCELAREGNQLEQADQALASTHLHKVLSRTQGPIVAATDYVRLVPEAIRAYLPEGRRY